MSNDFVCIHCCEAKRNYVVQLNKDNKCPQCGSDSVIPQGAFALALEQAQKRITSSAKQAELAPKGKEWTRRTSWVTDFLLEYFPELALWYDGWHVASGDDWIGSPKDECRISIYLENSDHSVAKIFIPLDVSKAIIEHIAAPAKAKIP